MATPRKRTGTRAAPAVTPAAVDAVSDAAVPGIADKTALLARRDTGTAHGFPEELVPVAGFGVVRVRGLSRVESLHVQANVSKGVAATERLTLHLGLLEPAMTEAEVGTWQKVATGGELDPVTEAVGRLSGLIKHADRAAYKSV